MKETTMPKENPSIGLFVTCLVDLFRPSIGFASLKLLEEAGCTVHVPKEQVCCGQPAYNSGDKLSTRQIATQIISAFSDYDYVVAPSGSCASMIKKHYVTLFDDDFEMAQKAEELAAKTYELVSFLTDILGVNKIDASYDGNVTYHDSCSGLREMNIKDQPRKLLSSMEGVTLKEMKDPDVCCGFGGTFCVKYADISDSIVSKKTNQILMSGADTLLAGDLGCLMNMAGKLSREGANIEVRHIAEVLAGYTDTPALTKPEQDK